MNGECIEEAYRDASHLKFTGLPSIKVLFAGFSNIQITTLPWRDVFPQPSVEEGFFLNMFLLSILYVHINLGLENKSKPKSKMIQHIVSHFPLKRTNSLFIIGKMNFPISVVKLKIYRRMFSKRNQEESKFSVER